MRPPDIEKDGTGKRIETSSTHTPPTPDGRVCIKETEPLATRCHCPRCFNPREDYEQAYRRIVPGHPFH